MIIALYILAAIAFYGLVLRNAPVIEDGLATHPAGSPSEVIELFPDSQRKAA